MSEVHNWIILFTRGYKGGIPRDDSRLYTGTIQDVQVRARDIREWDGVDPRSVMVYKDS